MVFKMFGGSDLLTNFPQICSDVNVLALQKVSGIEVPVGGFLSHLTSKDCIELIKFVNKNKSSNEIIFLNYLITDYICCGLSSPTFYTEFHKTLHAYESKLKLFKYIIKVWNHSFKNYKITSLNVDFVKHFMISLERVLIKISSLVPCVHMQCKIILDKIKSDIKIYEKDILDKQILHSLSINNMTPINSNNKIVIGNENVEQQKPKKPKHKHSIINQLQKTKGGKKMENKECVSMDYEQQSVNIDRDQKHNSGHFFDQHHITKKPKLKSNIIQNVLNRSIKSDPISTVLPAEQKPNAFQVMMLNAKKRKSNVK